MPKTTFHLDNVVSKTEAGLAPRLPNETSTTKYLRQDGSWAVPSYTEVVDNLTSTDSTKALSANQGNALNSKLGDVTFSKGTLSANASVDFTIQSGGRCVIIIIDSSNTRQAGFIVSATASGAIQYTALASSSDLSISSATNKFTVSKTQGSTPVYLIINLQGAMPTVS